MNRSISLFVYAVAVVVAALFYLVPLGVLGVLDACIHLGWYAR